MCMNGGFTERGIKEQHAYGRERFRLDPRFAGRRAAVDFCQGKVDNGAFRSKIII
jgi:hypothetical protein